MDIELNKKLLFESSILSSTDSLNILLKYSFHHVDATTKQ